MSRRILFVLTLWMFCFQPADAKPGPLYGKGAIVVTDASTSKPLAGVKVTLNFANPEGEEVNTEVVQVKNNSGLTDEKGYVALPVYLGTQKDGETAITVHRVKVTAEKAGYQSLDGVATVFYVAFRSGDRTYIFLNDVLLSPEGNMEPSRIKHTVFHPEATIEPAWGDYQTKYLLTIKVQKPLALLHERDFDKPLLRIDVLKEDRNPLKSLLTLNDDGKQPDGARNDGVYSAYLKPPRSSGEMFLERLPISMRARYNFQVLHTEEGKYVTWLWEEPMSLSTNLIVAAVLDLPVRWVVADTKEKAQQTYEAHFGKDKKL